jgi:hypothetical protein
MEVKTMRWALGCMAAFAVITGSAAEPSVERGDYLVNTIMTCANCHSTKGPPAAVAGREISGGLTFDEKPFTVTAPNITSDKETGVGNWSDADIKNLLLTGVQSDGVQLAEVMPTGFYLILTPGDLDSNLSSMTRPSSSA